MVLNNERQTGGMTRGGGDPSAHAPGTISISRLPLLLSPAVPSCQLSSACGRYLLHAKHTEHLGLENLCSKPTLARGGSYPLCENL